MGRREPGGEVTGRSAVRLVRAFAAVLVLAAVAHGAPDLPDDLAGKTSDWTSLADAAMSPGDAAKWKRDKDGVTGTNSGADWSVCELGKAAFGDCAIRARVKTTAPCGIRIQAGGANAATLVEQGTILLRGADSVGTSTAAAMNDKRKETDLVLVRRGGRLEVWVDGAKVLAGRDVPGDAKPGIGVAKGAATFVDVRVRRFPAPQPLAGEDGKPIKSTKIDGARLEPKGLYVHAGTRLPFPEKAGGFDRNGGTRYDQEGNDVEVDYVRMDAIGPLVASIYAYPALLGKDQKPVPFLQQFEGEAKQVHGNPNVADGAVTESASFCAGRPVKVRTQEFEMDSDPSVGNIRMATWLTAFRMGPWHVTYRLTAPKNRRDEALAKFEAVLTELGFPPTGIAAKAR
jgi:hypothetical protein